ncbi:hypothetical protein KCP78_03240 [Salmonella enterica subsp. enterica]|nr:hypothetical protein KCP78_03240 [Salmonella enterica subsp. enterica]
MFATHSYVFWQDHIYPVSLLTNNAHCYRRVTGRGKRRPLTRIIQQATKAAAMVFSQTRIVGCSMRFAQSLSGRNL